MGRRAVRLRARFGKHAVPIPEQDCSSFTLELELPAPAQISSSRALTCARQVGRLIPTKIGNPLSFATNLDFYGAIVKTKMAFLDNKRQKSLSPSLPLKKYNPSWRQPQHPFALLSMKTLPERIKKLRGADSQSAFSEKTGISQRTLSRYETGESLPDVKALIAICAATGASIEWLVHGDFPPPQKPSAEQSPAHDGGLHAESPARKEHAHPADVPVIGLASCGLSGWYNPGPLALRAPVPFGCSPAPSLFAVIAVGKSMQPEGIRQGYLLFCDSAVTPDKGDSVYVEKKDGTASIKKYMGQDDQWLQLQGWLEPDDQGAQKPYVEKVLTEIIGKIACVVLIKLKA